MEYFKLGYGRADPLRMLFHHADIPYEYVGYTMPEWKEQKEKGWGGEFRKVPRLYINGSEYQQSMPTLRMVGIKYGYYFPNDWKSCLIVDSVLDSYSDCFNAIAPVTIAPGDPFDREEEAAEIIEGVHQGLMRFCEKELEDGRKFIAGGKVTIADAVMTAVMVNMWENQESPWKDKFEMVLP